MKATSICRLALALAGMAATPLWAVDPLIVVEDHGGVSALPYYQALDLQPRGAAQARPAIPLPPVPNRRASEADMLPVRSAQLTPGPVARRAIEAPGLKPLFLVGDDDSSRAWLRRRAAVLRELGAVGLVVNVETAAALAALRGLVPGVTLSPVAADDLARRLGVRHYPVLITSTGIEQ